MQNSRPIFLPPLALGPDEAGTILVIIDWNDQDNPPPTEIRRWRLLPNQEAVWLYAETEGDTLAIGPFNPEETQQLRTAPALLLLAAKSTDISPIGHSSTALRLGL